MTATATIYIIVFIVLCFFCMFKTRKHKTLSNQPLITPQPTHSYYLQPLQNEHSQEPQQFLIYQNTTSPSRQFLIDQNDIDYYQNKLLREQEFERQYSQLCQERGIAMATIEQIENHQDTNILDNYIINEVLGNNHLHQYNILQTITEQDEDENLYMYNDSQNVHDSTIQRQLKNQYSVYQKDTQENPQLVFSEQELVREAKRLGKDTNTLVKVLQTIKNRNATVHTFNGDSEMKILETTWKAGDDNTREQILNNLIDCDEETIFGNKNVVCPTGVTSRIVESTYINNPDNTPRTKDMYREEMLNKASLIRDQLEHDSEFTKKSDHEQSRLLKTTLLDTYQTDYNNILSIEQINDFTKDWIDHI